MDTLDALRGNGFVPCGGEPAISIPVEFCRCPIAAFHCIARPGGSLSAIFVGPIPMFMFAVLPLLEPFIPCCTGKGTPC